MRFSKILPIACAGFTSILLSFSAGCVGSQPTRYYRIEVPPPPPVADPAGYGVTIQVGNLDSPPIMRDGRILYQVGAHEVGAYEYHRWVETPDRMIQSSLVRLLRASGKYQSVDTPRGGMKADYVLQGWIHTAARCVHRLILTRCA